MEPNAALAAELAALPPDLLARVSAHGFDRARFLRLASRAAASSEMNHLKGEVRPPAEGDVLPFPAEADVARLREKGLAALRAGKLAMVVLAGGMATRMGGVVKALVPAVDGKTFLELRLGENKYVSEAWGPVPLWLMTSDATDGPIRDALAAAGAPPHVATFQQDISLRLTPEGKIFRDDAGLPSTYATGHGDLPDALRRSGLLKRARQGSGVEVVWIANLDNLGATIDPIVLGLFLEQREAGKRVMVEVCDKAPGDKGGGPVHAEGTLQVVEEFRLPPGFDPASVKVFNTNTFLVDAPALDETPVEWSWFRVEKQAFGRVAVQFERLVQELTRVLPAAYLRVPREGVSARFLPVKDTAELERRRADLAAVTAARHMR